MGTAAVDLHKAAIEQRAETALASNEVRELAREAKTELDDLLDRLRSTNPHETEISKELKRIADALENEQAYDLLEGVDVQHLMECIRIGILREEELTELAGGHVVGMCDKSRYELTSKILYNASKIGLDAFKIESVDMVHIDEINLRVKMEMSEFENIVEDTANEQQMIFTGETLQDVWNAKWGSIGEGAISIMQLPLLADAVYAKCDGIDGLVDGLIDDPRNCTFDPATDLPPGSFTAAQAEALKKIYEGPKTSYGLQLFHH